MADRSRKRKTAANKQPDTPPVQVETARSDDGVDDNGEYEHEEYAMKRQRNNAAVNKTRQKKRQEEFDTVKRVKQLREENAALEKTVESLRHELGLLKEMVLSFASNRSRNEQAPTSSSKNQSGSSR
ncbi:BZIP domain-containing protein [Aphelenchoides bicaudatus]|nr:BZIP domain-containing protein [Aphelenchoides bicaudatus]